MRFVLQILVQWIRDSQFHKTAASAAAGTSIGIMTVIGVVEQKSEEIKLELSKTNARVSHVELVAQARKELVDERFAVTNKKLDYLIHAIDTTNQNVLNISRDAKKSR